jgi:hypothetical protein
MSKLKKKSAQNQALNLSPKFKPASAGFLLPILSICAAHTAMPDRTLGEKQGFPGGKIAVGSEGMNEGMNEEEEDKEPDDGYWPITRFAMRFALWTVVFSVIGAVVIAFTGFHFSF